MIKMKSVSINKTTTPQLKKIYEVIWKQIVVVNKFVEEKIRDELIVFEVLALRSCAMNFNHEEDVQQIFCNILNQWINEMRRWSW